MKKFLYVFSALALLFASCSSDSDSDNTADNSSSATLIKKIIYSSENADPGDYYNSTILYSYNGTKLTRADYSVGGYAMYYYTGDLITKIEYYTDLNTLIYQDLFEYNETDALVVYKKRDDETERTTTYTYNADNTVSFTRETEDLIGNANYATYTGTLQLQDGEVVEKSMSGGVINYTRVSSFDGKNSPFKNVTGFSKIAFEVAGEYESFGRSQNRISYALSSNEAVTDNTTYVYNATNYPISSVLNSDSDGMGSQDVINAQYFYE
ncbi:MAG TPA: hypothetical protein VLB74_09605 [Flavobacterium sp.]|uniref:hypothetical protein n=1 Tax=Flavobacterium sp. TaxID=239 RepID=UPI002C6C2C8D|nr:hypothetical protein [Flavobacterium sp.]HSD14890.1 hypothetical protein [Flavobacterium sp.]